MTTLEKMTPRLVVGIPAHDEEEHIDACLDSVFAAAANVDPVRVLVVVAADSCTDLTVDIARSRARREPRLHVVTGSWRSAGAARAAAISVGLAHARQLGVDPAALWVATTDADSQVDLDWFQEHLRSWASGDHALAGIVQLPPDTHVSVIGAFREHYGVPDDGHVHVHGANIGVRGDAYLAVGGFPDLVLAEDHALFGSLRAAGYRCRSSGTSRVTTSARLVGRASGGFAEALRTMVDEAAATAAA